MKPGEKRIGRPMIIQMSVTNDGEIHGSFRFPNAKLSGIFKCIHLLSRATTFNVIIFHSNSLIQFLKLLGLKQLLITLKLVIPLEGDVVGYRGYEGPKDFMFSGTKADLFLQTRTMINRQRRHKSTSYKPGVYKLTSSLTVSKFGRVRYVLV